MSRKMSRKKFIRAGTTTVVGLTVVPSTVLGKSMGIYLSFSFQSRTIIV